ncbi:MAG: peptidoglycan DD-metalloendopeptidase family protein [Sinobacteraceae bacterium]|nr:peptidoglycan DD-metalloendopeptidase family protein [Nevskiaceae bacterium]
MNLVLLFRRRGELRNLHLSHRLLIGGASGALLVLLTMAFVAGMQLGQRAQGRLPQSVASVGEWTRALGDQKQQIGELRTQLQERIDALAARMGQVNAHVIRLDALGKRLTQMANIDDREFDFDTAPSTGGPETEGLAMQVPDLSQMLAALEDRVALRDAQLSVLENVILQRELREQIVPGGRPVKRGFISSYYGERQDPFTGHQAFHKGLDFAGSAGAEVIAVAAGIVTSVGLRSGFGHIVEVNHGDGLVTRYAHNSAAIVKVGDKVQRGQTLALMGSTGRSTGPHVHFEVLRNGRPVNPLSFIGQ